MKRIVKTVVCLAFLVVLVGHAWGEEPSHPWRFSLGGVIFYLVDGYDNLATLADKDYDFSGTLYGGRASVGKGRNSVNASFYFGDYDFDSRSSTASAHVESQRVDIDAAWSHVFKQEEKGVVGFMVGGKVLHLEKEAKYRVLEVEQDFDGDTDWFMGALGVFGTLRLSKNYPLYLFGSFNVLLGQVSGEVLAGGDPDLSDENFVVQEKDESDMAYGLNGTLGLQYRLFRHLVVQAGYRGQILNSTDGFMTSATFYDGHQSLFVGLDFII
jgi:opacity protein-like surface antigen